MYIRYLFILLILLCFKAAFMLGVIIYAGIGLGPDEAQYWTWSQALDFGYYSKPPGIAWQNFAGTALFGNTEFGVRSIAFGFGLIVPILIFFLTQGCALSPLTCFFAAIAWAFSPIGMLSQLFSITDGGMILFWTAASAYVAYKATRQEMPSYELLGLLIFFGALFKWPIYAFWAILLLFWWIYPRLISLRLINGIVISLLALLPSVYWNVWHNWATFRHVGATMTGGHGVKPRGSVTSGNFFEFFGAQALLVSPVLFVLLLFGLVSLFRKRNPKATPPGLVFCGVTTLSVLGLASILSFFMKMQGNWCVFAYPTAFTVISWYAEEEAKRAKKWLVFGIVLSFALSSLVFALPSLQSANLAKIPYKINPFRHNVGWKLLGKELKKAGYDPKKDFLFGDKYQTASILSFYGEGQKRAYFFNLSGARRNQFSFWPGMEEQEKGHRGFFVVTENAPRLFTDTEELIVRYEELLTPYFETVHFLGVKPIFFANGEVAKGALIFECTGYLGKAPKDPDLY